VGPAILLGGLVGRFVVELQQMSAVFGAPMEFAALGATSF
jgi:hypothetical protein